MTAQSILIPPCCTQDETRQRLKDKLHLERRSDAEFLHQGFLVALGENAGH